MSLRFNSNGSESVVAPQASSATPTEEDRAAASKEIRDTFTMIIQTLEQQKQPDRPRPLFDSPPSPGGTYTSRDVCLQEGRGGMEVLLEAELKVPEGTVDATDAIVEEAAAEKFKSMLIEALSEAKSEVPEGKVDAASAEKFNSMLDVAKDKQAQHYRGQLRLHLPARQSGAAPTVDSNEVSAAPTLR